MRRRHTSSISTAAGAVAEGVWRPGVYFDDQIFQAFRTSRVERRAAEQSLLLLVERLNEILLYVEPEGAGLDAYGTMSRELLILAATDAENTWTHYMRLAHVTPRGAGYSTRDYVRLQGPLHLAEYQVTLAAHALVPQIRPFDGWSANAPSQSLAWYDAYNKAKHDRTANLGQATVMHCIEAVAANLVLFCVRFGPYSLFQQTTPLASHVNQLFQVDLVACDTTTFYVPLVELPASVRTDLACFETKQFTQAWTVDPLVL
jgi:hypothetical protein